MKSIKLKWYSDASHGWLAVKRDLLKTLGVIQHITTCSYERGKTVYLEEDCDARKFIDALNKNNINFLGSEKYVGNRAAIRSYERFELKESDLCQTKTNGKK